MNNHPIEYLNSGGLFLLSFAISFVNIFSIDFNEVREFMGSIEEVGITTGALGILLVLSISYPLGYLINAASFQILRQLRSRVYSQFNATLPPKVKSDLVSIYQYKVGDKDVYQISMDGFQSLDNEGIYLNLIKIHLLTLCADSYSRANAVWITRTRFFRLFSTSCLFSFTLLIISYVSSFPLYQYNRTGDIISNITIGMMSILFILTLINMYLYYIYLKMECDSFLARYLTVTNRI